MRYQNARIPVFVLLTVLFLGGSLFAQILKVAVVDSQKVFENSEAGKAIILQLQSKEKTMKGRLDELDRQILSFQSRLSTRELTLTQEARRKLSLDIDKLRIERRRVQEDESQSYLNLRDRLFQKAQKEMLAVIRSFARERSFSLVFDLSGGGVLYFDLSFDITEEIVRRYNSARKN